MARVDELKTLRADLYWRVRSAEMLAARRTRRRRRSVASDVQAERAQHMAATLRARLDVVELELSGMVES